MKINYKKIRASLLKGLPERTVDVIDRRFGLISGNPETLEAIGQSYQITRERVRQIEREGFSKIKDKVSAYGDVFEYFKSVIASFGGMKKESDLLDNLGEGKYQNYVSFLMYNVKGFERIPEDKDFYAFWTVENNALESLKKVVKSAVDKLEKEKRPLFADEIYRSQKDSLNSVFGREISKEAFKSYLDISKNIQSNYEGKLGLKNWLEINPKGIKDKAYLVFKKETKPLHFAQVATLIGELPFPLKKKVHIATVHNELIKDSRFVLVGRGLYALKEWGYAPGVVKEIIAKTLKDSGKPLSKEEVIGEVLKQRFVKENTIFLNLQDKNHFIKGSDGKYTIREA